jgi:hypothetical protein
LRYWTCAFISSKKNSSVLPPGTLMFTGFTSKGLCQGEEGRHSLV